MTASRNEPASAPTQSPEVRAYLKKLLLAIFIGLVLMTSTAVWAWNRYGKKLEDAPPLPEGTPPISSGPITTR